MSLKQHRGRLSNRQIADGMTAATLNARRLVSDAILLLESERWPTAAALAVLSIEEAGKPAILRTMALATTDAEIANLWKDFRSHRRKNAHGALVDYVLAGARKLSDFEGLFAKDAEHPAALDAVKQIGLYVDAFGEAECWSCPQEVVDEPLARSLVAVAKALSGPGLTTEREIELWIEHMGPAWMTPNMKFALILWQQAMHDEGLVVRSGAEMADFVFGMERHQGRNSE